MSIIEFAFQASENVEAPPLLLVHGALSSRNHWLANWDGLVRHFRLIAVDLPGHGDTSVPPERDSLHPDNLAAALEALRERLGIERWAICGQSFGAGITLRYALAHPERTVAQVFTNANAALKRPYGPPEYERLASRLARIRSEGAAAIAAEPFHPRHAKRFAAEHRDVLAQDAAAIDPEVFADLLETALPHLGLRSVLDQTRVPTLLVNGRWESAFQPLRDWIAGAVPGIEVVDLEGGHSINIEQPEAFNAAVIDFLGRAWR